MYNSNDKKSSPTSYRLSTINRSNMYTDMEKFILIYTCISNPLHTYILSQLLISWEKSILSCNFSCEYDIYCIRQFSTPGCRSVVSISGLKNRNGGPESYSSIHHSACKKPSIYGDLFLLHGLSFLSEYIVFSACQHHVISYHTIPYHAILYYIIPCHAISNLDLSYHALTYHIISCYKYHIVSYHIISCNNIPYNIMQ